jgi:ArsR family transcriptional regulator
LREGNLERLPIDDNSVDLFVSILMLHHLPDVPAALREVARAGRPGGKLLVVDFHEHQNETFRVRMADRRAGISTDTLKGWMTESGLAVRDLTDLPTISRPEHELAPLPRLYVAVAEIKV